MSRLDELYRKLFQAEENGNTDKVEELREIIKQSISEKSDENGVCELCGIERKWNKDGKSCDNCGHDHIIYKSEFEESEISLEDTEVEEIKEGCLDRLAEKDRVKLEFFYKTRKKAFHKNIREQLESEETDDIDLALAMTSMLTHSLIEMKKEGSEIYKQMDIYFLTETVSKFLSGDLKSEKVVEKLKSHYGRSLNTKLIKEE